MWTSGHLDWQSIKTIISLIHLIEFLFKGHTMEGSRDTTRNKYDTLLSLSGHSKSSRRIDTLFKYSVGQ